MNKELKNLRQKQMWQEVLTMAPIGRKLAQSGYSRSNEMQKANIVN